MAIEEINVGSSPNSRDGDSLRESFQKVNRNFEYLDELTASCIEAIDNISFKVTTPPLDSRGAEGDTKDQIAGDENCFYYCTGDYLFDSSRIWKRIPWDTNW